MRGARAHMTTYVYDFSEGNKDLKDLLGGKGANLAEMSRIGLPVPPGCTITTELCTYYYDHKRTYPSALQGQMKAGWRDWSGRGSFGARAALAWTRS
mgnify:CR=1 FL=1